nr:MAG: polyprotein [Picornavirales sp.]
MTTARSLNKCEISCSDCCKSIPVDDNVRLDCTGLKLQSGLIQENSKEAPDDEVSGLVKFDDDVAGEALDLPDAIHAENTTVGVNAELKQFLSRPVLIGSYTWILGGTTNTTINPWYAYMNHTSIKKKLDNYYLFRGNLKIKVIVNASPFYYGCMMVSYNPLLDFAAPIISSSGEPNVSYSQLPRVYVYPSASQGGTMTLPFIYHREWLDITSATDVTNMGILYYRILDTLQNANGSTTPITVSTYAWLEDVSLSGPTVGLALQSGSQDEYGKNIISTTSSAIARAAGQLKKAPLIGPYATATEMIAKTSSTIAKAFGYTNVPVVDNVHAFKPTPLPVMASTDIGTSVEKMTLDSKNELTIDPRICGADLGDELEINNIASRESYLTKFTWTAANNPTDLLWNVAVTPVQTRVTAGTSQSIINATPTFMVSRMFNCWRGDMEFRFKVICSQYHRGRLRFSWDPNGAIGSTSDSSTEVYTKIVDISSTTDVTLQIPYMKDTAWLYCNKDIEEEFSTSAKTQTPFYDNGVLTVRVLNEQTSPITSANITILVFCRGADNLEFSNPCDIDNSGKLSPFTVQSGLLAYDNSDEMEESIGLLPSKAHPSSDLIYMGETVKSLRTLLRRANGVRAIYLGQSSSSTVYMAVHRSQFSRFPMSPGYDTNGIHSATGIISGTSKSYNWTPYTTLAWIGQCFLGCRGSIMWYANSLNQYTGTEIRLSRVDDGTSGGNVLTVANYSALQVNASNLANMYKAFAGYTTSGGSGFNVTNTRQLSTVSASFPFYSIFKFRNCCPTTAVLGSTNDDTDTDAVNFEQVIIPRAVSNLNTEYGPSNVYPLYVAAGTDFNFIFFLAVPTLYYYASYPVVP